MNVEVFFYCFSLCDLYIGKVTAFIPLVKTGKDVASAESYIWVKGQDWSKV